VTEGFGGGGGAAGWLAEGAGTGEGHGVCGLMCEQARGGNRDSVRSDNRRERERERVGTLPRRRLLERSVALNFGIDRLADLDLVKMNDR
jgi:hypothetical protein